MSVIAVSPIFRWTMIKIKFLENHSFAWVAHSTEGLSSFDGVGQYFYWIMSASMQGLLTNSFYSAEPWSTSITSTWSGSLRNLKAVVSILFSPLQLHSMLFFFCFFVLIPHSFLHFILICLVLIRPVRIKLYLFSFSLLIYIVFAFKHLILSYILPGLFYWVINACHPLEICIHL
jgi:hypothetical protein